MPLIAIPRDYQLFTRWWTRQELWVLFAFPPFHTVILTHSLCGIKTSRQCPKTLWLWIPGIQSILRYFNNKRRARALLDINIYPLPLGWIHPGGSFMFRIWNRETVRWSIFFIDKRPRQEFLPLGNIFSVLTLFTSTEENEEGTQKDEEQKRLEALSTFQLTILMHCFRCMYILLLPPPCYLWFKPGYNLSFFPRIQFLMWNG